MKGTTFYVIEEKHNENGQNTKRKRAIYTGLNAADFTPESLTESDRNMPETNGFLKIITILY